MTCDQLSGIIEERSKIDRLKGEGAGKKIGATIDCLGDKMPWQCYVSFAVVRYVLARLTVPLAVAVVLPALQIGARSSNLCVDLARACPPTCASQFAAACRCR